MQIGLVVEGHGEVQAAPVLVRRILHETLERFDIGVTRPVRMSRSRAKDKFPDLERQVLLASSDAEAVLVLFDADDDCPAELGPHLLTRASSAAGGVPVAVVLANREYEAWFLAGLESLRGKCRIRTLVEAPDDPEGIRDAKGRVQRQMDAGAYYSETVDQPRMSALFAIDAARSRAPSLDKLCRDITRLVGEADARSGGTASS